jgi:hypothetical protein
LKEVPSRLRRCDRVIGAGALALLVILFLFKWYGVSSHASVGGVSFSASANGWHTFTNSRWLWLVTIIVALAAVWIEADQRGQALPGKPGELVAGLGALSMIFILYRIINHPTATASTTIAGVHYTASSGIKLGIWLGLIAAAAITYGGYLEMQERGDSPADAREVTGGTSAAFSGLLGPASPPAPKTPPADRPPPGAT